MDTFKFAVDKKLSLQIVKEMLSHLKDKKDVIYHENLEIDQGEVDSESEEEWRYNVVPYRHKLAIVEIELDWNTLQVSKKVSDHYIQLLNTKTLDYSRSDCIEIYAGSEIDSNSEIDLTAYLHGTQAECDVSYTTFSYDFTLQCWVSDEGINCNGIMTILDFSDYFKDS